MRLARTLAVIVQGGRSMSRLIALLTIRTPSRQISMAMALYSLLAIAGVPPYPGVSLTTVAFGQAGPCQDDGSGCAGPILVLPQPDINILDRELFTSDGSNTSEVFDAGNYFQATFRLAQSEGGEDFVGDWDTFLKVVALHKNAADSIHGIPLLITKAQFTDLQPNAPPEGRTFFMAGFAVKTIYHQDITILTNPAFQVSGDPVASIQLKLEGTTVEVDPAGNTPLHFSSPGEKTVLATVRFASGFVGENLFRVIVDLE
jgi:hypothetical protein